MHPPSEGSGSFAVSLVIRYRHPRRPDEAGMTVVVDKAKILQMKDQLESRGFLVIEIVTPMFAKPTHDQSD